MGYDYEVIYKPGKENNVADALSRVELNLCFSISHATALWLEELREYFKNNEQGKQLMEQIEKEPASFPYHFIRDGLVYRHGRIMVPPLQQLRARLLQEFHSSPTGGHSGITATTKRLAATFSWLGVRKEVTDFIKKCHICQSIKPTNHKPFGLLQPLPTPESPWLEISMDFITHLPPSKGRTVIWVIVDRLSKFAHFIALPTHYTAASLAALFMREIYRLHGLPKTIVSDRDPIFVSRFWTELFKQMGTTLLHSSAYHPQTDGQSEVVNRCLESYLRAFVFNEPNTWQRYLYLAEYSYNTTYHSAIDMTPFMAVYGREATSIHDYSQGDTSNGSIEASLQEHDRVRALLQAASLRAKERMTKQANKHRMEKEFKVNDLVYLKLQNYRQQSVEKRASNKLSKRYYGPFKIIEKIGKVAYKLQLPTDPKIHPVFHVSLLKTCHSETQLPTEDLSQLNVQSTLQDTPEAILNSRDTNKGKQLLVRWSNRPMEESTWEYESELRSVFPDFTDIGDNVNCQGEGAVTTHNSGPNSLPVQSRVDRPKRNIKQPARLKD